MLRQELLMQHFVAVMLSCLSGPCYGVLGGFNALFTAVQHIFAAQIQ